jgi:DNA-3-methyladenine glycosylase
VTSCTRRSSRGSSTSSGSSSPSRSRTSRIRSELEPHERLRELLAGSTLEAARGLIGARLIREPGPADPPEAGEDRTRRVGRIVEVEAYIGEDDQASHARFGRTLRNAVMYGGPGRAYVYLVYGMYHCLNVVTEPPGRPAAVLVRAIEPVTGSDAMRDARIADARRRRREPDAAEREATRLRALPVDRLGAGPGLAASALSLDRTHTGLDLLDPSSPIRLEPRPVDDTPDVVAGPRIGIAYAGEPWVSVPWRFVDARSRSLSR